MYSSLIKDALNISTKVRCFHTSVYCAASSRRGKIVSMAAINTFVHTKIKDIESGQLFVHSSPQCDMQVNFPCCTVGSEVTFSLDDSGVVEEILSTSNMSAVDFLKIPRAESEVRQQQLSFESERLSLIADTFGLENEEQINLIDSQRTKTKTKTQKKKSRELTSIPFGLYEEDLLSLTFLNRMYSPCRGWKVSKEIDRNQDDTKRLTPECLPDIHRQIRYQELMNFDPYAEPPKMEFPANFIVTKRNPGRFPTDDYEDDNNDGDNDNDDNDNVSQMDKKYKHE